MRYVVALKRKHKFIDGDHKSRRNQKNKVFSYLYFISLIEDVLDCAVVDGLGIKNVHLYTSTIKQACCYT